MTLRTKCQDKHPDIIESCIPRMVFTSSICFVHSQKRHCVVYATKIHGVALWRIQCGNYSPLCTTIREVSYSITDDIHDSS